MSKNYNIKEKAQFIRLTILLHDLQCYDEALQEKISDKHSLTQKFRNTRNVFVSLHNLKDALSDIQVDLGPDFISRTRKLRKELEFVGHVRNKGVGHLDKKLLERAAQWMPQIFYESSKENDDYIIFECYRAVLETSINSHINSEGEQKVFSTDIDLLYPENGQRFFAYLSFLVNESISWLSEAKESVKSQIDFHTEENITELSSVAGQTNFDLKSESSSEFSEDETRQRLLSAIEKLEEIGAEQRIIDFVKKEFLGDYNN